MQNYMPSLTSRYTLVNSKTSIVSPPLQIGGSSWLVSLNWICGHICKEMDALELLDEDCWEEVLNRVEDPEDLRSCNEVCLLFQGILRTKNNAFMSSLVLPHLLPYLRDAGVPYKDKLEERKALSKYRRVCKFWCHSFDKLFEFVDTLGYDRTFSFKSGKKTEEFLQKFATHNGNPLRGRLLSLFLFKPRLLADIQVEGLNEHEDEAHFHVRKLRHLLERFGSKMWAVNLFEANQSEELAFFKNLRIILAHLPNLRSLRIVTLEDVLDDELEQPVGMEELLTFNTPPALPLLENLVFGGICLRVESLILEKYAAKLKSLGVGNPRAFPELGLRMDNLETLSLNVLDASTSLHGLRQVEAPQLGSLVLGLLSNRNNVEVWPIDELFGNIQHLPIQSLEIAVRGANVFVGESGPKPAEDRVHHESIASLRILVLTGSVSLNFLSWCPKLKSAYMFRREQGASAGHPSGVAELLDVNELVGHVGCDLYQSNIWETLPNLESFQLKHFGKENKLRLDEYVRAELENRRLEEGWEDVEEEVADTESECRPLRKTFTIAFIF